MVCKSCQTTMVEINRYDGDKVLSSRIYCPNCEGILPRVESFGSFIKIPPYSQSIKSDMSIKVH